jgi:RNA polymerase sigma-70 factor (ECF subfamily)
VQDATVAVEPGDGVEAESELESSPRSVIDRAWSERVRASYDEVRGPLWRALVAWSASPDVADEAVAEAFAQLLRRGPEVRDPSAWAWRTAFRLAAGDLQRRRADAGPGDDTLTRLPASVDRLPDDALDLVHALAQLSDQQRRCIALVDIAGHTAPSAAAVLDTSAATVRVQLMRARRRLRTLLADPASPEETP